MAIPDFQTLMLPLLRLCKDEKEHTNRGAIDHLSSVFDLSPEERKELLPSGRQAIFDNRIAWARAHLKMAGLIENTKRGVFRITKRGKDVLNQKPDQISIRFLMQFQEYSDKKKSYKKNWKTEKTVSEIDEDEQDTKNTPEEQIEEAYETLSESKIV